MPRVSFSHGLEKKGKHAIFTIYDIEALTWPPGTPCETSKSGPRTNRMFNFPPLMNVSIRDFVSPILPRLRGWERAFYGKGPSSSSSSADDGLLDLGRLVAGADDLLALAVADVLDVLVLALGALPDLDLAAAADDADAHGREQVVRRVGVHVDAAVEHGRRVLADAAADHGFAARVVLDELRHVVDHARDGDEAAAVLRLVDVVVPFDDGELVERNTPVEFRSLLVQFLLLLLHATFLDLVLLELLEIEGETELLPAPDAPLGRIILVPFDCVAVVGGKFVVEIVIAFT